jgi:hypothetical protein
MIAVAHQWETLHPSQPQCSASTHGPLSASSLVLRSAANHGIVNRMIRYIRKCCYGWCGVVAPLFLLPPLRAGLEKLSPRFCAWSALLNLHDDLE